MTEQDAEAFGVLMYGLGETYGEPVSEARIDIYFNALRDLSIDDIRRAATVHSNSSRFFPKPVDFRDAIRGNVDDAAEMAWSWLLTEVRRIGWIGQPNYPNDATKAAVKELYGTWGGLCERLPSEGVGRHTAGQQFKATFKVHAAADARKQLPSGNVVGYIGPTA